MKGFKTLALTALLLGSTSSFAVDVTLSPVYTAIGIVRGVVGSAVSTVAAPSVATSASSATSVAAAEKRDALELARPDAEKTLTQSAPVSRNLKKALKILDEVAAENEIEGYDKLNEKQKILGIFSAPSNE